MPADRLMKMRWMLVFKSTDNPAVVKAKARLVALGFDLNLGLGSVRSPTLTTLKREPAPEDVNREQATAIKKRRKTGGMNKNSTITGKKLVFLH